MLYSENWNKPDEVGETLLAAADLIEQYGHIKGQLRNLETGAMCFIGALQTAMTQKQRAVSYDEASRRTLKAVGINAGPYPHTRAVDWNNEPERTGQEVIDAMRLAAYTKGDVNAI